MSIDSMVDYPNDFENKDIINKTIMIKQEWFD